MKLTIFLKKVDTLTSKLSPEDLADFIHEIARTLPEDRRDRYLETLEAFNNQEESQKIVKDDGYNDLQTDIEMIKKTLIRIDNGERRLNSEYNEEWDDWYNSDADEVLFMDPEGILDDIDQAMELIHRCVDMEFYKEGCGLAEILSVLGVAADGDYNDYDGSPLTVYDLAKHELLSCDFKRLVRECLYLTYMGNPLMDRPDEMFCMMGNFGYYDVSLENVLQSGNDELPQFDEFLAQWIMYLGEQRGRYADKFLLEAQSMMQDEETQIENAGKYAVEHPSLYKQFLQMELDFGQNEKFLQIGREALDKIPCSYVIRSEIALLTAEYACKLQNKLAAEACWLEAFRSNSTVINYLRIRLQTEDWLKYADTVKLIYEQTYEETQIKRRREKFRYEIDKQEENGLNKDEYCLILFFEEQFDRVFRIGMNEKDALGWSLTFMKQGLALFLLLLYEGKDLPAGLREMLGMVSSACRFKADEYFKGTDIHDKADDKDVFWKLFCSWKNNVRVSEDQREKWIAKIDKWIEFRVAGIMDGNYRKYYGECASYIAALGEVQESLGVLFAKSYIMERYRSKYSRRRAFHQELRNYGMMR